LENEKGENGGSDKRLKITEDATKNVEIKLERELQTQIGRSNTEEAM
jgi:hypothetical protein